MRTVDLENPLNTELEGFCELVMVRHGEQAYRQGMTWRESIDPPLSDLGRRQATAVGERLRSTPIDAIYASPWQRDRPLISFLADDEVDALLAAPDPDTWIGRRDHALLLVAIQAGLRVSELAALSWTDVELGTGAHLRCHGKGRKERITPLTTQATTVLADWQTVSRSGPDDPVFSSRRRSHLSTDGIGAVVSRHTTTAAHCCASLGVKTVTPHVLRHTCAMRLLAVGVDTSVIALWLGHEAVETTQMYLHADLTIKERALARTAPTGTPPGRYRPPDTLLAFLDSL